MIAALAKYLWMGPPGNMKTSVGMAESQFLWDLANGRLNQLIVGASASGKDCATDLIKHLSGVMTQGSITMAGCLRKLKEHDRCLVFVQPELEKLLCKRKDQYSQEQDLIEMLDGSVLGRSQVRTPNAQSHTS